MKVTFTRLGLLVDMFKEDGKRDPRWVENVTDSVGEEALGLLCFEDLSVEQQAQYDSGADFVMREFSCDELEFTDEHYYNFMGSADECERFYEAEHMVFECKADGSKWVMDRDDLDEF